MKIACEACEAKYSIADDKVRGKTFKLRCKKCSNMIVVRGVTDDPPAKIWHLVIAGEQLGPFTLDEVREQIVDGTLAWREGQDVWLPVDQIAELAANAPQADKLRGERNESSVLFSLGNLAKVAVGATDQQPLQEGSGLIDIRSMASAYRGSERKPIAGSSADLPVFATPTTFSEPAVLVPLPMRVEKTRLLYILVAAVIALATVATILLAMVLQHETPMIAAAPPIIRITQASPPPPPPQPPGPPVVSVAAAPSEPKAAPKPHHVAVVARAPKQPECDDVKCIVDGDLPCCAKPPALTAAMTTAPMSAIHARAMACGQGASGRVRIHVKVAASGHVTEATVETTPDPELGRCVAEAVRHAQFPQTANGGSFGVPYTF